MALLVMVIYLLCINLIQKQEIQIVGLQISTRTPTSAALIQRQLAERTTIPLRHLQASGGNRNLPHCLFL